MAGGGGVVGGGGGGGKDELAGMFSTTASVGDLDDTAEISKFLSSGQLTQYVYNLRMWIACTILQRVDAEIQKTNVAFAQNTHADCRGFSDIQIGKVGLDRLKKTANVPAVVAVYVPMLPMLLPFLEISTNQEYLVQRIRDLAKGCVLGEYRWNAGGTYGGVGWDEHLPTDSAVGFFILYLFYFILIFCFLCTDYFPYVLYVFGWSIAAAATARWSSVL